MRAGLLRHRVAFKSATEAKDGFGQSIKAWTTTVGSRWVEMEPLEGRELLEAQQVHPEATMRVRMRYWASVTPAFRIYYGSRVLEILSVRDINERHERMELLCKESK